jgi:hypothetical protein
MTTQDSEEPTFGIGAVSRLTGVPIDTLRVWERRYNAVTPRRSPDNKRCYTRADVARLALIKQLVDQGHAVGCVAPLPEEALRERVRVHAGLHAEKPCRAAEPERPTRVLVYGDGLPFLMKRWAEEMPSLTIIGKHGVYADFERDALTRRPEVLLAEWPALHPEAAARIRDLAQRVAVQRTIVVYGFAATPVLERLNTQGVATLRAPVTAKILEEACLLPAKSAQAVLAGTALAQAGQAIPPRRFDAETLVAITRSATRIQCECPQHLVDLIFRLGAFEAYSDDCENRNAQDAVLHAHLHRTAGQARGLLEDALAYLLRAEGIDIAAVFTRKAMADEPPANPALSGGPRARRRGSD